MTLQSQKKLANNYIDKIVENIVDNDMDRKISDIILDVTAIFEVSDLAVKKRLHYHEDSEKIIINNNIIKKA